MPIVLARRKAFTAAARSDCFDAKDGIGKNRAVRIDAQLTKGSPCS